MEKLEYIGEVAGMPLVVTKLGNLGVGAREKFTDADSPANRSPYDPESIFFSLGNDRFGRGKAYMVRDDKGVKEIRIIRSD